ncbi:hypothetical protein JCM11251_006756 [Rhodosporidiobolus azoricus]
MAHTGTTSTSHSTASSLRPFPVLSPTLLAQINNILTYVPPAAHSWADLKQAHKAAQRVQGNERGSGVSGGEEDNELYAVLLKLTHQHGTTWHARWANALASSGQSVPSRSDERADRSKEAERRPPHRTHRARRPSDDLDFLKHKLAAVDLAQSSRPSQPPRRTPSTPAAADPSSSSRPRPPPARPKSTPPATTPRPRRALLVAPGEHGQGYSSADEWVGVPRGRAAAGARLEKMVGRKERVEEVTPHRSTRKDGTPKTSTPTAAPPISARHPLLERRLAELSLSQPHDLHSSPSPAQTLPSSLRHAIEHPASAAVVADDALSSPSSLPFLISGQYSPPEATALALNFSRLCTLGPVFDTWCAKTEWVKEREREVQGKRGEWEGRCALVSWRGRVERVREIERKADQYRGEKERERSVGGKRKVTLRSALQLWREKRLEREREREEERRREEKREREGRLKEARDQVVELRRNGVLRRAMEHWYILLLHRRATRFRTHHLLHRSFSHLRTSFHSRRAHSAALTAAAEERWAENEAARARSAFGEWKRRADVRGREREWLRKRERGLKENVWEDWRDKLHQARYVRDLESAADKHYAVSLASASLETWERRKRRDDDLSSLAFSTSTASLRTRLSTTLLPRWRLRTRLSLSLSSASTALLRHSLTRWIDRYEHTHSELAGRADAFVARRDAQLAVAALGAWADAAAHHARLVQTASTVSRRTTLSRTLAEWTSRSKREQVQGRKADVVRAFMLQRGAWRVWVERGAERRRERWKEGKKRERGREALLFWLQQTRQKQQDRLLVETVQARSNQRLLSSFLLRWRDRLILHREVEQAANEVYEGKVVQVGFRRWADQTVKAAERLVFADEHRALKLEEKLLRAFHHWRRLTSRSRTLKDRLASFLLAKEEMGKEEVFAVWRERFMRGREKEVRERRETTVKQDVVRTWMGKSKSLLAHRHYTSLLLSRSFTIWHSWTPPLELVTKAIERDRTSLAGGACKVWHVKAEANAAVRAAKRHGRFGSSPASSPAGAPYQPSSPSSSPSSSFPPPAANQATPTPALSRARQTLTRASPSSSCASPPPLPAPESSISASSFSRSQSRSLYHSTMSSASPSTHVTTPSTSISPSAFDAQVSSRPRRLSEEYASLASLQPPLSSRSRQRTYSISSQRSVKTSRSAPAGRGGAVETDDEQEDEHDEHTSARGIFSLSRPRASFSNPGPAPRRARTYGARSEDEELSGAGRGDGGAERRDVRAEFASFQDRLAAIRGRNKGL